MSAIKNMMIENLEKIERNQLNRYIEDIDNPQLLRWENGNPVFYLPQYLGTRFQEYTVNGSRLLSNGSTNVKTAKNGNEFLTAQHSMRPSNFAGIGNVCSSASNGCKSACLESSGNASIFQMINAARDAKTIAWYLCRDWYLKNLNNNLKRWERKAQRKGKILAVRLNVLSDIRWENYLPLETFQNVMFYDYTKHVNRFYDSGYIRENYYLTFSKSETNSDDCINLLNSGANVTMVFHNDDKRRVGNRSKYQTLPKTFWGFPVIDGDTTDARFQDKTGKPGYIVGLRLKSANKTVFNNAVNSGFSIPTKYHG